ATGGVSAAAGSGRGHQQGRGADRPAAAFLARRPRRGESRRGAGAGAGGRLDRQGRGRDPRLPRAEAGGRSAGEGRVAAEVIVSALAQLLRATPGRPENAVSLEK